MEQSVGEGLPSPARRVPNLKRRSAIIEWITLLATSTSSLPHRLLEQEFDLTVHTSKIGSRPLLQLFP